MTKRARDSWTHRFNALIAALGVVEANASLLKPLLGDHTYAVLLAVAVIGNGVLRQWVTSTPIGKPK